MVVEVKLFGALRKHFNEDTIILDITPGSTVEALRQLIKNKLGNNEAQLLIDRCAIANSQKILHKDALLTNSCELALLPPVCGG